MMRYYLSLLALLLAVCFTVYVDGSGPGYCGNDGIVYNCRRKNPCLCSNLHTAGTITYHRTRSIAAYVRCSDDAEPQCEPQRCELGYIFNLTNPNHDPDTVCKKKNPDFGITVRPHEAETGRSFEQRCFSVEGHVYFPNRLRPRNFDCRKHNPCTGGAGNGPEYGRCVPQLFYYPAGEDTPERYIKCWLDDTCEEKLCPEEHIFNPSSQTCQLDRPRCNSETFGCGPTRSPCGPSLCVEGQLLYPQDNARYYIECGLPDGDGDRSCERRRCEFGDFDRETNQCPPAP